MAITEQKKNNSRVEKRNVMRNLRECVANRGSQAIYFLTVLNEGVNIWQLTCACVKKGVIVYDGQQFFRWSKKRWPFVVVKSIWCLCLPIATANMIDKVSARWNAHIFFPFHEEWSLTHNATKQIVFICCTSLCNEVYPGILDEEDLYVCVQKNV